MVSLKHTSQLHDDFIFQVTRFVGFILSLLMEISKDRRRISKPAGIEEVLRNVGVGDDVGCSHQ